MFIQNEKNLHKGVVDVLVKKVDLNFSKKNDGETVEVEMTLDLNEID